MLAEMYQFGWGVRKDISYSHELLRRGIDAGNPFCAWRLGAAYMTSDDETRAMRASDAEKCFNRWLTVTDALGESWTAEPWYEGSIPDALTRDLFQMYEKRVLPSSVRPMLRTYRENIITLINRMMERAHTNGNLGLYDSWANTLGCFKAEEL